MADVEPDLVIPSGECSLYAFGDALAAWGDELLVGATFRNYAYFDPNDTSAPPPAPPVCCLFRRVGNAFSHVQTLAPSPAAIVADGFGRALALGSSFAIVGSPGYENGDGPIHQFERAADGSFQVRALLESPESLDGLSDVLSDYGVAVCGDEDWLIVGAGIESDRRNGTATTDGGGAVYVFARASSDAKPIAVLRGTHPNENFGAALALSEELLVVGASGASSNERLAGAVFVYRREAADRWRELCRIEGRHPGEQFGAQVAFAGARLAVAAPGRPDLGAPKGSGRVDLFELVDDTCRAIGSVPGQPGFGLALAVQGDRLAIGEPMYGAAQGPVQTGRVALYRWNLGAEPMLEAWLTAPNAEVYARLGSALALGPGYVAAGAPGSGTGDGRGFVAVKGF